MRRTMHAAAIFLVCATQIYAQSPSDRKADEAVRSTLVRSDNHANLNNSIDDSVNSAVSNHSSGQDCFRGDYGRPFSQLAMTMQCNDWRPNLWDNYASERAAMVNHISRHVDMQCKCFECKSNLHSTACDQGCGGCANNACNAGTGKKARNRYREPISTLFANASDSCNATCGSPCQSTGTVVPSDCHQQSNQIIPVSAVRPDAPSIANPPRDRFATPIINNPRSAANTLDRLSQFQTSR